MTTGRVGRDIDMEGDSSRETPGRDAGIRAGLGAGGGRGHVLQALAVLAAFGAAGCGESGTGPVASPPPAGIHVTHISLLPRIAPPDHLGAPADAGWPDVGQSVRWQGHLYNTGAEPAPGVGYRWVVDGGEVANGQVDLPPGETVVELPLTWSGQGQDITLALQGDVAPHHSLTVRSDALSLTLWMDAGLADRLEGELDLGPFPVWASQEVRAWNGTLEAYTSPDGPVEILDRIRLDLVEVLPAGSRKPKDVTTDLAWMWVPSTNVPYPRHVFEDASSVLHELLHQRGITDLYAYRVFHGHPNGSEVLIREPDGTLAAGGPRMPLLDYLADWWGKRIYLLRSPYDDRLMGSDYSRPIRVDPHTAYGLNMRTGLRTPRWIDESGNTRRGWTIGAQDENDYMRRVPERVRLQVEIFSEPASSGVRVEAFFDHGERPYHNRHGPDPDAVAETDEDGVAVIPLEGLVPPVGNEIDSDVIIFRVTQADDSRWGYVFLPVYELNMAFFQGAHELADLTLRVNPR